MYILLVKARDRPSGDGTRMEAIHPAPAGISYKTLGLALRHRSKEVANEEEDRARANRLFPVRGPADLLIETAISSPRNWQYRNLPVCKIQNANLTLHCSAKVYDR